MLRKARPGRSCVCKSYLPRQVYLAGADRAGLTAAQHLLRKVRASPDFYAEQELRPVGPRHPFFVSGSTNLFYRFDFQINQYAVMQFAFR